jgi:hypothetical protein
VDVVAVTAPNILPPSPVFTANASASSRASWRVPGRRQFLRLALGAALLERLDLLAVGAGERHRDALGQEVIARVSGADFDLVAFAAEAFDGFDEESTSCRPW